MRRIALFIATVVLSTPLFAMQCPADMARIDALLESNPPTDTAMLERVQALRAEGESLHEAGKHAESVEVLGEALSLLKD